MKNELLNEELLNESVVHVAVLYSFIKRLATPFKKWDAYKLGIIDEKGKVLRKRATLTTSREKAAFTLWDVLILNIKKLIERLPFGRSRLASYIAALFLLRESEGNKEQQWSKKKLCESFLEVYESVIEDENFIKEIEDFVKKHCPELEEDEVEESLPANVVGTGQHLAGVKANPPMHVMRFKTFKRQIKKDDDEEKKK